MFERLVRIAGRFHPYTGRYVEPTMDQTMAADEVDKFLRQEHLETFDAWLCLSLEKQMEALSRYLVSHGENRRETVRSWIEGKLYVQLVPPSAEQIQKALFITDLEVVLELESRVEPDCHGCQTALVAMLDRLQQGFMRIGTLQQANDLNLRLPEECRQYCLSSLSKVIEGLEAGEFCAAWRALSEALAAVQERTRR